MATTRSTSLAPATRANKYHGRGSFHERNHSDVCRTGSGNPPAPGLSARTKPVEYGANTITCGCQWPRREILIHRPHVRKAHYVSPGKFTFGVSGPQTYDDLVRILALHREFCSAREEFDLDAGDRNGNSHSE